MAEWVIAHGPVRWLLAAVPWRTFGVMTTSIRAVVDERGETARGPRFGRWFVRVTRALWLRDRGVVELRWAAVTLVTMCALAVSAKLIDVEDHGFDLVIVLLAPAAIAALALGWSRTGERLVANRSVRYGLGPAILVLTVAAAGPMDIGTLGSPPATPLIVLAMAFAAITPGYPIAAALFVAGTVAIGFAHMVVPGGPVPVGLVSDEFVVRSVVVVLSSTGMFIVVRIASAAEARASRYAARSRARVDALEKLELVGRGFDGSRPVRDVIQGLVDGVSREFEITLVSMYLPDDHGRLSMVGVAGYHSPFHVIDIGVGVIGRAASLRETQFVADVFTDPDYRAARDDVRSEVATPILHDGELLGVVNFEGTLARPLGPSHVALAEMLARSIAAALRSARLDEERRERLHAIERVLEVSRGLVRDLDRGRTMHSVVEAAADLLHAERVVIAGRDVDGTFRVEHQTSSLDATQLPPTGRALGAEDGPALEAVASGAPVVRTIPAAGGQSAHHAVALPIRIDDEVAAVLTAIRPASRPAFGDMDLRTADLLVTQVAVALHNAQRHARVSDAAVRDPLTGLLNRRYFDEAVETAFATARRSRSPLSLIVLDLDRFSMVNNEHGHSVGDAVLRRVGRAMSTAVRAGDTVVRYGGEEFVIIAPGSTPEAAVAVAERVRTAVAGAGGTPIADGPVVPITVSAGVASLLGDELDGHALFRAADSALLAAKRAGRDRVVAV